MVEHASTRRTYGRILRWIDTGAPGHYDLKQRYDLAEAQLVDLLRQALSIPEVTSRCHHQVGRRAYRPSTSLLAYLADFFADYVFRDGRSTGCTQICFLLLCVIAQKRCARWGAL